MKPVARCPSHSSADVTHHPGYSGPSVTASGLKKALGLSGREHRKKRVSFYLILVQQAQMQRDCRGRVQIVRDPGLVFCVPAGPAAARTCQLPRLWKLSLSQCETWDLKLSFLPYRATAGFLKSSLHCVRQAQFIA